MLYIASDQVFSSTKNKGILEAACPNCGKCVQVKLDDTNFCDECWATIAVKIVEVSKPTERIYHGW